MGNNKRAAFDAWVSTVEFNEPDMPKWYTVDIHEVPRKQFDTIPGEEKSYSAQSFWTKAWELGDFNTVTFYCNEPPTEKSE